MNKTYVRIIILVILFLFLMSNSYCLFDTIGNLIKDLKVFRELINNRSSENHTIIKKINYKKNQENSALQFFNIFLKMFVNRNRNIKQTSEFFDEYFSSKEEIDTKKKNDNKHFYISKQGDSHYYEKKGTSKKSILIKRKKSEDSIFEKLIISDIMLIYSLAEIFLSLSIAFIIIPTIVILRKWIKSIRKNKIKEVYMDISEFKTKFSQKNIEDEDCSICLDKIITSDNQSRKSTIDSNSPTSGEVSFISHLDCGHIFHSNCIKEWINRSKETCPFCRKEIDSITHLD